MDNFRKINKDNSGRSRNVDGIINFRPGQKPANYGRVALKDADSLKTEAPLADFGRKDGFHPSQQGNIGLPAENQLQSGEFGRSAPVAEVPGIMPAKKPKKKRWSPFKRIKNWSWRKRILWTFIGLLVTAIAIAGFLVAKGYINIHKVLKGGGSGAPSLQQDVDPNKLKGEGDGRVNILDLSILLSNWGK